VLTDVRVTTADYELPFVATRVRRRFPTDASRFCNMRDQIRIAERVFGAIEGRPDPSLQPLSEQEADQLRKLHELSKNYPECPRDVLGRNVLTILYLLRLNY